LSFIRQLWAYTIFQQPTSLKFRDKGLSFLADTIGLQGGRN